MAKRYVYLLIVVYLVSVVSVYAKDQTFSISITIRKPITIEVKREFDFGRHERTGSDYSVTIAPENKGSAIFAVTGDHSSIVSYTVAEESVQLSNGGETLKVGLFKVTGGGVTGSGNIAEGELKNISVGATAYISANQPDTTYYGTATLRVTYN